ncbi:Retrovirus-related Pol polyprotein from transposon [Taenia solium]|eukprot:TsM_001189800 transcript=TsM_001189800 gene=TsM_001189800
MDASLKALRKRIFKWENEHTETLKGLKRNALPCSDSGDVAVGGVHSQRDGEGSEHVIAYTSARLNKKMRQKSATELEPLAIYTTVRHFKHYLVANQLAARTDHQAPTWLRTMEGIERSVARWYEELQQYDLTVQYRKGTAHRT